MEPPTKRSRADTAGASANNHAAPNVEAAPGPASGGKNWTREDLAAMTSILDPKMLAALLHDAALKHSDVAQQIETQHARHLQREQAKVLSFDNHFRQADYKIHDQYANVSARRQFDAAGDISCGVDSLLNDIVSKATKPGVSYGTKYNAVEAIRKILESTCEAGGEIGKELHNGGCDGWGQCMLDVLNEFEGEELDRLAEDNDGEWLAKLQQLAKLADESYVFEELKAALAMLEGVDEDDEDEEDEDEDDEDEEEDEE